jgi:8-oxo-(d)GTP phosphatase
MSQARSGPPDPIRAAGVVLTRGVGKDLEVAVIHRQKQRDWSLPKGKFEPGEHVIEVAVRECVEETGFIPILETPLPTQHYRVDGLPKVVDYWRATVGGGEFVVNREVDRLRWLTPREAARLLTYPRDGELVVAAAKLPPTMPFILVRHTMAERRADWARRTGRDRDDPARGLLERGTWQARRLIPLLRAFGIRNLHSSDAARCLETLRPAAAALGSGIRLEPNVSEDVFVSEPKPGKHRTVELFNQPWPIALCSHRPVIPGLLGAIRAECGGPALIQTLRPGSFYVFHRTWINRPHDPSVVVVSAEHHDLPPEHE